jgi:hypothetical protein
VPRKKSQGEKIASAAAAAATRAAMESAPSEETEVTFDDDASPEADALRSLLAIGDSGEVTFRLRCIAPPSNRGALDDVERDDIPNLVSLLREWYGPGKYVLQAVDANGTYVRNGHRVLTISPLSKPGAVLPAHQVAAPATGGGIGLPEWQARQDRLEEQRHREAREDRKDLIALAGLVLPALLGRSSGPSLADLTTALTNMRDLSGGGGGGGLDSFIKGVELGKDMGGGSDSIPAVIRDVIKDLSPMGKTALDRIANRGRPLAPAAAPPPAMIPYQPGKPAAPVAAPQGAIPVPTRPTPEGIPEPVWVGMVLPLLTKLATELLEFAQNGADPFLCAEALVGKTPRTARAMVKPEQIVEWLRNPNWWALLKDFKPELEPYQGYCDDVRQALVKLMTEPEEEPEQP